MTVQDRIPLIALLFFERMMSTNYQSLPQILSPYKYLGIGSLPYQEVDQALNFVFSRSAVVPFWPELPRKDVAERMMARAERAAHPRWSGYSENEASGLHALLKKLKSGQCSPPIIKCQVPGPLTMATVSEKLAGSFEGKLVEAREVCFRQIKWQHDVLKEFNIPLLVVVDEPCLGKEFEITGERWKQVHAALSYLYTRVSELGAFLGLHCCGESEARYTELPLDLCSFDLTAKYNIAALTRDLPYWKEMLGRGAVIALGVYRSTVSPGEEELELQRGEKISQEAKALFSASSGQLLFSTSCGLAHATQPWCEMCYR